MSAIISDAEAPGAPSTLAETTFKDPGSIALATSSVWVSRLRGR